MAKLKMMRVSAMTYLLSAATGCGGAGADPGDMSGAASAHPGPAATWPTVSVSGFVHAPGGSPLSGASVCPQDTSACATSGDDGSFSLSGIHANVFVSLTFQKAGFLPSLRVIETQASAVTLPASENVMFPAVSPQMFMGAAADPSEGCIAFFVTSAGGQPAPSISVTLTGTDGVSHAPIYLGADGSPSVGAAAGTGGGFVNLPADLYSFQFGNPDATCTMSTLYGYPMTASQHLPSGEAGMVVPVLAGYVTNPVSVSCVRAP